MMLKGKWQQSVSVFTAVIPSKSGNNKFHLSNLTVALLLHGFEKCLIYFVVLVTKKSEKVLAIKLQNLPISFARLQEVAMLKR